MSTGKLDQSLDEIMKDGGSTRGRGRGIRRNNPRRAAPGAKLNTAPAGGISKSNRPVKGARSAPTGPALATPISGESKIIVSGLVCLRSCIAIAHLLTASHSPKMSMRPRSRYVERSEIQAFAFRPYQPIVPSLHVAANESNEHA